MLHEESGAQEEPRSRVRCDPQLGVAEQLGGVESAQACERSCVRRDVGLDPRVVIPLVLIEDSVRGCVAEGTADEVRCVDLLLELVDPLGADVEAGELEEVGDVSIEDDAVRLNGLDQGQRCADCGIVLVRDVDV
jgi:hypothetical protein